MKRGRPRSIRRRGKKPGVKRTSSRQRAAIRARGFTRKRKGR